MNISQDSFDKLVTTSLLLYCMIMFSASWYTGKALDLQGFLTLATPIIAHSIHIFANSRREVATIQKDTAVAVTNGSLGANSQALRDNTAAIERKQP